MARREVLVRQEFTLRMTAAIALAACSPGCATWSYTVQYDEIAAATPSGEIEIAYQPKDGGVGNLTIRNGGSTAAYLVWDDLVVTFDGRQQRAYKGSVRKMHMEMSVPKQVITPGATMSETIVAPARVRKESKRPATAWDWTLGVVYGLGVLIGNATWQPDWDDVEEQLPDWKSINYSLIVPVEVGGIVHRVEMNTVADDVAVARVRTQ
jgi:hypothetical protein